MPPLPQLGRLPMYDGPHGASQLSPQRAGEDWGVAGTDQRPEGILPSSIPGGRGEGSPPPQFQSPSPAAQQGPAEWGPACCALPLLSPKPQTPPSSPPPRLPPPPTPPPVRRDPTAFLCGTSGKARCSAPTCGTTQLTGLSPASPPPGPAPPSLP